MYALILDSETAFEAYQLGLHVQPAEADEFLYTIYATDPAGNTVPQAHLVITIWHSARAVPDSECETRRPAVCASKHIYHQASWQPSQV